MLDISKVINGGKKLKWRFTKYYTGIEEGNQAKFALALEYKDDKKCRERPTDVLTIATCVDEWVREHIGLDFTFRPYQREYIVTVLYNILNDGIKVTCLEAPTGSGKSWIAFIVSGVAWTYYRKTSYILVSDLGLLDQYLSDVGRFELNDVGHMRGLPNYVCELNNMPFPSGKCRTEKVDYNALMLGTEGWECAADCPCIRDRRKAITAPITVMTYALYLCHMNDVVPLYKSKESLAPFDKRDIVICDECHVIPQTVQSWCSPAFDEKSDTANFSKLYDFIKDHCENAKCLDSIKPSKMAKAAAKIVSSIESKALSFEAYSKYVEHEEVYASFIETIREKCQKGGDAAAKTPSDPADIVEKSVSPRAVLHACDWLDSRIHRHRLYKKIIKKVGSDKMVVNASWDGKMNRFNEEEFCINCVYEHWLVDEFFNKVSNAMVMMTATIGDYELFSREIGVNLWNGCEDDGKTVAEEAAEELGTDTDLDAFIKDDDGIEDSDGPLEDDADSDGLTDTNDDTEKLPEPKALASVKQFRFLRIPSTFDFSKSPIYILPQYKLSYALKEQNLPKIIEIVERIIAAHKGQRGIIHTGSYDFSRRLFYGVGKDTRNRLLCYTTAREKDTFLTDYTAREDAIIVGPTLSTGLNFPDDLCRFMILLKVPYPSLSDQLVKAKKDLVPGWYIGETLKTIIQGFGRGIRHPSDWCTTYVVDGSFVSLVGMSRDKLQPELTARFQYINA